MATTSVYPIRGCPNPEVEVISGSFTVTSGVCTVTSGRGFTPTESGTGEYTITFDKTYTDCLGAPATVTGLNTTEAAVTISLESKSGSAIVYLTLTDQGDGTADATDLQNGQGITFICTVQRSSLPTT